MWDSFDGDCVPRLWWVLWIPTNNYLCALIGAVSKLHILINWTTINEGIRTEFFNNLNEDVEASR